MLVAAAVCPHPPLLVPGVAAGASGELDGLRLACDAAVAAVLAAQPDLVVVVGAADSTGAVPEQVVGSLAPYGVPTQVGTRPGEPTLPLSLTLGRWLLARSALRGPALLVGVEPDAAPGRCQSLGVDLAERAERVALLVMGDGSARRSAKGPGYLHPDAAPFDEAVAAALATGDVDALAALSPARAATLLAAGRAAWQVLAGAARGRRWAGALGWAGSPYGVTYLVATWTPAP